MKNDHLYREKIVKNIVEMCKKQKKCYYCNFKNGIVKKWPGEPLKVMHDRYKKKENDEDEFNRNFEYQLSLDKELDKGFLDMKEEIDPLKTY